MSNYLATDNDDTLESNLVFLELEYVAGLTNFNLAETNEAPLISKLAFMVSGSLTRRY